MTFVAIAIGVILVASAAFGVIVAKELLLDERIEYLRALAREPTPEADTSATR